jgi:hypothetical protein
MPHDLPGRGYRHAQRGAEALRRIPGVVGYRPISRPGDRLPGGVMTQEMDILTGTSDTHDDLIAVVDGALSALSYEFRFADGIVQVPAAALRGDVRPPTAAVPRWLDL